MGVFQSLASNEVFEWVIVACNWVGLGVDKPNVSVMFRPSFFYFRCPRDETDRHSNERYRRTEGQRGSQMCS